MDHRLIEGLMESIAPLIKSYVDDRIAKDVAPLQAKLKEYEAREPLKGEPGKDADPAAIAAAVDEAVAKAMSTVPVPENGKDADPAVIAELVADEVAKIPAPTAGKDADPLVIAELLSEQMASLVADEVRKTFEVMPKPHDGKSVTVEEVLPAIEEMIERKVAALPVAKDGEPGKDGVGLAGALIDRSGELVLTLTDGATKALGVVVGKDADQDQLLGFINEKFAELPVPKNGKDGFGFEDLDATFDGERTITLKFTRGEDVKEFSFKMPVVVDRGVYKDDREQPYEKADGVTFAGSFWVAQKDAPEGKPQDGSKDWRLTVKRGRDGKDAVIRQLPPQGPVKA